MTIATLLPLLAMAAFGAFALYSVKVRSKGCFPESDIREKLRYAFLGQSETQAKGVG